MASPFLGWIVGIFWGLNLFISRGSCWPCGCSANCFCKSAQWPTVMRLKGLKVSEHFEMWAPLLTSLQSHHPARHWRIWRQSKRRADLFAENAEVFGWPCWRGSQEHCPWACIQGREKRRQVVSEDCSWHAVSDNDDNKWIIKCGMQSQKWLVIPPCDGQFSAGCARLYKAI